MKIWWEFGDSLVNVELEEKFEESNVSGRLLAFRLQKFVQILNFLNYEQTIFISSPNLSIELQTNETERSLSFRFYTRATGHTSLDS